jgi:hypothetical protein
VTYSLASLENLWTAAGGPASAAPQAAAIADAESSGNPSAGNASDPFGGSFGLWQINMGNAGFLQTAGVPSNWQTDPLANAKAAVALWTNNGGKFYNVSASGNSASGPWAAEGPGGTGNAKMTADIAAINAGNAGDPFPGDNPAQQWVYTHTPVGSWDNALNASGVGSAINGATGSTPGSTPASTGSPANDPLGINSTFTAAQTAFASFWTAHPAWLILAGIVLAIAAWALIVGGGNQTTVETAPAAAAAAAA